MSIEVLVDNDTILQALQTKADDLPEQLRNLTNTVAFAVDEEVKKERPGGPMPVITGNLQGSITIDNTSDYVKRIYPDEGIAPYAKYVIRGVRGKAEVEPMDFLTDGLENARPRIDDALEEFKSWLLE